MGSKAKRQFFVCDTECRSGTAWEPKDNSLSVTECRSGRGREPAVPVPLHHVDQVVGGGVAAQGDVRVVDFVLCQDALHCLSIQLTLRTLTDTDTELRNGRANSQMQCYR